MRRGCSPAAFRRLALLALFTLANCSDDANTHLAPWLESERVVRSEIAIELDRICASPVDSTILGVTTDEGALAYSSASDVSIMAGSVYAVADRMRRGFAVFYPDGSVVHIGGEGDGPGEMRSFAWGRSGRADTLFAYDPAKGVVDVYDLRGGFARAIDVPVPKRLLHTLLGPDSRGQFVLVSIEQRTGRSRTQGVVLRDTVPYLLLRAGKASADTLGQFLSDELYSMSVSGAGQTMIYNAAPPLGRKTLYALAGDNFWVLDNLTATLRILDLATLEWREFDLAGFGASRLTGSQRREYKERYVSASRHVFHALLEEAWDNVGTRRPPPLIGDVVGAHSSNLVLARDFASELTPYSRWHIFSGPGKYLGCVTIPTNRKVVNARGDMVATIGVDHDSDEEIVYLYRFDDGIEH